MRVYNIIYRLEIIICELGLLFEQDQCLKGTHFILSQAPWQYNESTNVRY